MPRSKKEKLDPYAEEMIETLEALEHIPKGRLVTRSFTVEPEVWEEFHSVFHDNKSRVLRLMLKYALRIYRDSKTF